MADNQPQHWQIGMWGPLASGKTTYLASVYLRHREVGWEIEPSDPSEATTMGFLTGEAGAVNTLASGDFPGPSPARTLLGYNLDFTVPTAGFLGLVVNNRTYSVTMLDISGEEIGPRQTFKEDYFASLGTCDGLVLLLDPENEHEWGEAFSSYYAPLSQLVKRLDHDEMFYAFCITKIDLDHNWNEVHAVPESDKQGYQENLRQMLMRIIGHAAYQEIAHTFDERRGRMFALSAVGRYQTPDGHRRPNLIREYGQDVTTRLVYTDQRWQPVGIFEPLQWLFSKAAGA